jgi:hypothetical protein
MLMNKRIRRFIGTVCAAVVLIAALSVTAFAEDSIEDQMAANSAAWWVAYNAGDMETCEALHQANVELAEKAAGNTGSAVYNNATGTWDITTPEGGRITSSSGGQDGKNEILTYTSTQISGLIKAITRQTYTDEAIAAYLGYGGTKDGLITSYNNAGSRVSTTNQYGSDTARTSAASEVAVVKAVLGLSDEEATQLQKDLESSKQAYESASAAYKTALEAGDNEAAAKAKEKMDAAHAAAQETRSAYNYTGDSTDYDDGGYYYGGEQSSSAGDGGGFFIIDVKETFRITATATGGGSISPSGEVTVRKGESVNFKMQADNGSKLIQVLVDGRDVGTNTSYTFTNVRAAHTIQAVFQKNSYSITASAGEGGSISPSGTQSIEYNGSAAYRIRPDEGYEISKVLVDGRDIGAVGSYTFSEIKEDHSIAVQFERKSYGITASAGTGGSISPSGTTKVFHGEGVSYSFIPETGYEVEQVVVDGQDKGKLNGYTFSNVTGPHSISVTFRLSAYIDVGDPSVTDSAGVSLNGGSIKSGYGITVEVPVTAIAVTDIEVVLSYNFGSGTKTVSMEANGNTYVLPINSASPTRSRVIYIPVETKDGTYTLNVKMTALDADGLPLVEYESSTVTVRGSMYEDDFTGDS